MKEAAFILVYTVGKKNQFSALLKQQLPGQLFLNLQNYKHDSIWPLFFW